MLPNPSLNLHILAKSALNKNNINSASFPHCRLFGISVRTCAAQPLPLCYFSAALWAGCSTRVAAGDEDRSVSACESQLSCGAHANKHSYGYKLTGPLFLAACRAAGDRAWAGLAEQAMCNVLPGAGTHSAAVLVELCSPVGFYQRKCLCPSIVVGGCLPVDCCR